MGKLRNYFLNHYPRTDFHELNQDWMITMLYDMINQVENFVEMNSVKYADPIQWNITRQYEKNTIVVDGITGTAYISSKPVPMGVALPRTEYWNVIFDLGRFITLASQNFANSYEAVLTTTATMPTNKDGWIVWNSLLYRAKNDIHTGDMYVVDGNIERYTVEMFFDELTHLIAEETEARIEADTALHDEIVDESVARENADNTLQDNIDAEATARENADNVLQDNIDAEATARENADTTLQDNIDAEATARQESIDAEATARENADDDLQGEIGTLSNLDTVHKANLVEAANEINSLVKKRTEDIFNVRTLNLDFSQDITSAIEELLETHKRLYFPAGEYYLSLTIRHQNVEIFGDGFYDKTIFHPTSNSCITLDARNETNVGDFYLHDLSIVGSSYIFNGIETIGEHDTDPINNVVIENVFITECRNGILWKSRGIWCIFRHVWCFANAIGMFVQPPDDCAFNHNSFTDCMFGNNKQYGVYMIATNNYRNNTTQFNHCNFQDNWNSNPNTSDVSNGFIYCNAVSFVDCYWEGEYGVANLYVRNSDVTIRGGVSILPKGTFCTIIDSLSYVYIMGLHGYGASSYNITDSGTYNNHCVVIGSTNTNYQMNSAYVLY